MKSEQPIRDKIPEAYSTSAKPSMTEPLEKDQNWSTADSNLARQRREAHAEALANEEAHYQQNHPHPEPQTEIFETPPQTEEIPSPANNRQETRFAMTSILANRRKKQ